MWNRSTAVAFNRQPMREPRGVLVIAPDPPPRRTRGKRFLVAIAIVVAFFLGSSLTPVLQSTVKQQPSPQAQPIQLLFPAAAKTVPGTTIWFTPNEVMAPEQRAVAPWPVFRPAK